MQDLVYTCVERWTRSFTNLIDSGTSPAIAGLPNEQIGYMASEEYASRLKTPHHTTGYHHKAHSNHSQPHVESPLRKASFPVDVEGKDVFDKSGYRDSRLSQSTDSALESETEDEGIHVTAPAHPKDKITGNGYDPPTEDLGPEGGNTEAQGGWIEETGYVCQVSDNLCPISSCVSRKISDSHAFKHILASDRPGLSAETLTRNFRYGVPILASDEVAKEQGAEYLQPAVSPAQERRGSNYYSGIDSEAPPFYQSGYRNSSRSGSVSNSRPSSRPGSIHGSLPGSARFTAIDDREDMHTPLEDVEEYEPLFPDEEGKGRSIPATERFKRREMKRFPSQDIWEDTPNSLQLQATVNTPEAAEVQAAQATKPSSATFEPPEAEKARKGEVSEREKEKLIPKDERLLNSNFKPHLREEMTRPGMKQRFPSRDIWEDSPDSARLVATVGETQQPDSTSPRDADLHDEGLRAGAIVSTSGRPDTGVVGGEQARDGTTAGTAIVSKPSVPPRPQGNKSTAEPDDSSSQALPFIPARPPKRLHKVPPADAEVPVAPSKASAEASLAEAKQPSPTEARKAPILPERPKPDIPPRPANPIARDSSESIPLSKVTSTTSAGSGNVEDETRGIRSPPQAPKPKPAVPSRPVGGKIAALKAGFLSDLDKRLQLGPQVPKPQEKAPEEEEEKAPLADARKGRAKGPSRRKPAATPAASEANITATSETADKPEPAKWNLQMAWTVWTMDSDGLLHVAHADNAKAALSVKDAEQPSPSALQEGPLKAYSESIRGTTSAMATQTAQQLETSDPGPIAELAKETSMSNKPVSLAQATAAQTADTQFSQAEAGTKATASTKDDDPTSSTFTPEITSAASQTGEKSITTNAGTEAEEKLTVIEGGDVHAHNGANVVVRESENAAEG